MSQPAPPPYTGGPPPPPVSWQRAPEGLAVATLVLGGIYTLVEVLVFAASFGAAETYGRAARQGIDSIDVFTTYDALSVGYLVMLPMWIVTCLFLQQARQCAVARDPGFTHQRRPVWVWLGWVVPVVFFWFPYQVVRDIVRHAWRDPWGDQRRRLDLGFWWTAWVVALGAGQVASRSIPWSGVPSADAVALLPVLHGVNALAIVLAFVLWVRIVRSIVDGLTSA